MPDHVKAMNKAQAKMAPGAANIRRWLKEIGSSI
jgi:hypothetical protein